MKIERITAIVPNFNHGRFLPATFNSLLAQRRPADEVIVIDDASTDESVAIIESNLPRFKNFQFLCNRVNAGAVRGMNVGLSMARGDVVAFVAADDVIYPDFFEHAAALLEAFPKAAFASGRTEVIDAAGNRVSAFRTASPLDQPGFIDAASAARLLSQDDAWFTGNVTLFRKAPLSNLGGFPEDMLAFTDGFVSRVLAVTYGVCYAPEVWGAWRRMEGGFAWRHTESREAIERLAEAGEQRMRASGAPFESGYPQRWKGRFVFGCRRFSLGRQRERAKSRGIGMYLVALGREVALTSWLFVWLRPRDLWTVLRRRL